MNDKIQEIKKLVIDLGERDWKYHIGPVFEYANKLSDNLKADKEIVALSALLHDIGRLKFGAKDHEQTGLPEARKILEKFDYPESTIEKVLECISTHGVKKDKIPSSTEAKILATADGRAHINNFVEFVFSQSKPFSDFENFFSWVEKKVDHAWNEKIFFPETKKELEPKYNAIKEIMNSYK